MSSYYDEEGLDNSAYHYSETLEMDRGQHGRVSPQRNPSLQQNPYDTYEDQNEVRQRRIVDPSENIPMAAMHPRMETTQPNSEPFVRNVNPYGSGYYNPAFENDSDYDSRPPSISYDQDVNSGFYSQRPLSMTEDGNDNLLRKRSGRQTSLPVALMNGSNLARADSILEQENAMYIKKLAAMSESERIKEIQKLPIVLKRKQALRSKVQEVKSKKSKKGGGRINCCTECMYTTALSFRRAKEVLLDGLQALRLWQKTLKSIGAKFGTSTLSYFTFLKWLLTFNIFSFVVNFSFITIPQLLQGGPNRYNFSGLEILSGAGYFQDTVLHFGFYTNSTVQKSANLAAYNMQLAYIFTIGFYLVICFLSLVYSMAKSFRENFINPNAYSAHAAKLLFAWDFSVTNEKAVKHRQKNLSTQVKEALSELLQVKVKLTIGQKIAAFLIHVLAWALSMGVAAGCCVAVYFLSKDNLTRSQETRRNDLDHQAASLILPVVVAIMNMVTPFIYSLFGHVEKFKNPRHEIYVLILRNVFLKMSIIGVLCYYWLQVVAESNSTANSEADLQCWETLVGADIYRLIVFDFLFCLLGSFFGEFLRRIIGTKCFKTLGMPEFDIARNVLDLIYAQTLAWIGIYFSPLLPVIQILKLFIIFYVKKVSLMMNCVPPRRAWRASQMTTVFIFLLFFPSFTGVLSVVAVTVWSRNSSTVCGPFRNLDHPYSAISTWIAAVTGTQNLQWLVWIYHNFIESVLFFFILTIVVLVISYLYWQIILGRKTMVKLLEEQIANEGKKKMFLLKELTQLQQKHGVKGTNRSAPDGRPFAKPEYSYRFQEQNQFSRGSEKQQPNMAEGGSEALAIAMRAKQQADSEDRPSPSAGGGGSEALAIAMRAKQEADSEERPPPIERGGGSEALVMAMRAKQQADSEDRPSPSTRGGGSEALAIALGARQQAESEERQLSAMKEFGSDVLQLAMRARQQAEAEEHQPHLQQKHSEPW